MHYQIHFINNFVESSQLDITFRRNPRNFRPQIKKLEVHERQGTKICWDLLLPQLRHDEVMFHQLDIGDGVQPISDRGLTIWTPQGRGQAEIDNLHRSIQSLRSLYTVNI
ncbi:hypothetical protein C5167_049116 [Papaver somniferum]|uniref:Uncharacterized protein n=1 Tax=Papaver somniferum TaxID=3469 RepID=A0A4Y7KL97_PAPSO|nr:hypothetical protein C5167_049116 [Papaver somniferum]